MFMVKPPAAGPTGYYAQWESDYGVVRGTGGNANKVESWTDTTDTWDWIRVFALGSGNNVDVIDADANFNGEDSFDFNSKVLQCNALALELSGDDTPMVVMACVRPTTTGATRYFFTAMHTTEANDPQHVVGQLGSPNNWRVGRRGDSGLFKAVPWGTPASTAHIIEARLEGGLLDTWTNGAAVITGGDLDTDPATFNKAWLGARRQQGGDTITQPFVGQLAALVVAHPDALSLTDQSNIRTAWSTKYGVTI